MSTMKKAQTALSVGLAALLMSSCSTSGPDSPRAATSSSAPAATASSPATAVPTYRLDADHATYTDVTDLRADATHVVIGKIDSAEVVPGDSPGTDGAGDPLPAIPHTNYVVTPQSWLKGSDSAPTITVVFSGGATDAGNFVLDGGPVLAIGDVAMYFLQKAADGTYVPLAGGAAAAPKADNNTFALPGDVSGAEQPTALTSSGVEASTSPNTVCSAAKAAAKVRASQAAAAKKALAKAKKRLRSLKKHKKPGSSIAKAKKQVKKLTKRSRSATRASANAAAAATQACG